jgi:hypothetical protein
MLRPILAAFVASATLLGAGAAQAGTRWSIGISVPGAVVVADSPRYYVEPAPVYYAPPPVVYAPPPPVYYAPAPRPVYYAPAPRVVYETTYREPRWDRRDDRRWEHHHRWEDRSWGDRRGPSDVYGPGRGR